jgi:hypothetical protein
MADITYPNKNTGDQFTAADANEIKTAVNTKVDKVSGKQLSDENYTSAEKSKLAGLANYYKGTYPNLAALETAHPTGQPGWEAIVDEFGVDAVKYIWDESDETWVLSSGSSSATFAEIGGNPIDNAALASALATKVSVVSGKDLSTNDFDATAKDKVDNLPANTIVELGNKAELTQVSELTLLVAGWSLVSGVYRNEITHASITADSVVDVIPANSTIEVVRVANVLPETNSEAGKVYVYAKNIPSASINVTINIFN